ncbi:MAG: MFS transporter, partial [Gammaproteobacteria bacterium]|nr:MFS transporter [Gammaproteobacteria bacterium]NIV20337.1 MFS transporter [Gammaproteobacteria bacterium]
GQAQHLWHYYLAFGVLGATGIAFIMTPAAAIVSAWFSEGRGTALGIIAAGSSASAIVFYPLNGWLIAAFGWRAAMAIYGGLVVLGTVPPALLLYRQTPPTAGTVGTAAGAM